MLLGFSPDIVLLESHLDLESKCQSVIPVYTGLD